MKQVGFLDKAMQYISRIWDLNVLREIKVRNLDLEVICIGAAPVRVNINF